MRMHVSIHYIFVADIYLLLNASIASFHFFRVFSSKRKSVSKHAYVGFLKCMLRDNQVAINMFDRHFFK